MVNYTCITICYFHQSFWEPVKRGVPDFILCTIYMYRLGEKTESILKPQCFNLSCEVAVFRKSLISHKHIQFVKHTVYVNLLSRMIFFLNIPSFMEM